MYSKELEELIEAILADGVITSKERSVLHKRAMAEGVDVDELDVVVEGRLVARKYQSPQPAQPETTLPPLPSQSTKYGSIRKCPNCGNIVKPGTSSCTDCGFEYRDIGAVNSVERLSKRITEIEKQYPVKKNIDEDEISPRTTAMISALSSFPIPNTREDLLEFIIYTESKFLHLDNSTKNEIAIIKAYKAKYVEGVEKAQIYFGNDPQFRSIFARFPRNKRLQWRELSEDVRDTLKYLGMIILIGLIIGLFSLFMDS